jgi:adenosylcobinamide-GDP ribazoletransferase
VLAAGNAFRYFSIIPIGAVGSDAPDGHATAALPIVGAVIGLASGAGTLVGKVAPHPWGALVAFAMLLLLSGAIHVDGFLDCCDSLLASAPAQRRLGILKDPRQGTYAVVGMVLLAVFWIAALENIPPSRLIVVLAFSGALSRLPAMPVRWLFPYARATNCACDPRDEPRVRVAQERDVRRNGPIVCG